MGTLPLTRQTPGSLQRCQVAWCCVGTNHVSTVFIPLQHARTMLWAALNAAYQLLRRPCVNTSVTGAMGSTPVSVRD